MEIRTQRLVLRPVEIADLESAHAYASDLENTKYMMFLPYASFEETRAAIEKAIDEWKKPEPDFWEFAVVFDGVHIGGMTLYFVGDRTEVELGWVLDKRYWRRGLVTEAAQALAEYARDKLGAKRVFACCDEENAASRRVMEKLGMRLAEKGTRTNRSTGDMIHTELVYEILF